MIEINQVLRESSVSLFKVGELVFGGGAGISKCVLTVSEEFVPILKVVFPNQFFDMVISALFLLGLNINDL